MLVSQHTGTWLGTVPVGTVQAAPGWKTWELISTGNHSPGNPPSANALQVDKTIPLSLHLATLLSLFQLL